MCRLRTPFLFCLRRLYLRAFRICNPTLSYTKNIIHKKIFVIECSMQSFPSIIRKINIGMPNGCPYGPRRSPLPAFAPTHWYYPEPAAVLCPCQVRLCFLTSIRSCFSPAPASSVAIAVFQSTSERGLPSCRPRSRQPRRYQYATMAVTTTAAAVQPESRLRNTGAVFLRTRRPVFFSEFFSPSLSFCRSFHPRVFVLF